MHMTSQVTVNVVLIVNVFDTTCGSFCDIESFTRYYRAVEIRLQIKIFY